MAGKEAIDHAEAFVKTLQEAANNRPCVLVWEAQQLARKVRDRYEKEGAHG